eukprot:1136222-Pelagomonas_calceolata.AAC.2
MKSKEGQSGSFAGFAVAGSGQGQADTTATSNGHAVAAAAAWHGSTAAKPPKSPVAANQQTAPLHKPPQEQPQGQQQQEQQQQQQQVPLWHATLLPPNHSLDSAHLPPSPDLSPPPTGFSDHTDLGLNCPRVVRWQTQDVTGAGPFALRSCAFECKAHCEVRYQSHAPTDLGLTVGTGKCACWHVPAMREAHSTSWVWSGSHELSLYVRFQSRECLFEPSMYAPPEVCAATQAAQDHGSHEHKLACSRASPAAQILHVAVQLRLAHVMVQ